jgi:hypothetical protein
MADVAAVPEAVLKPSAASIDRIHRTIRRTRKLALDIQGLAQRCCFEQPFAYK